MENHFVDSYDPTIENSKTYIDRHEISLSLSAAFQKSVSYKGQDYLINVVDTAGQVRNNLYNL